MFDHFPDGIVVAGPEGWVEYASKQAHQYLRLPNLVGLHLRDAIPFDDLNGNSWYDSMDPYEGLHIRKRLAEQSWWSETGEEFLITASLVRTYPGQSVRMVVVGIRTAWLRHRLDRERSDLVATVAHELRSPLTGIKGFTATLLSKWDQFSDDQRQLMLETVDADADRLSRLITELLDAARIDSGRMTLKREPVRMDALVSRVLRRLPAGEDAQFADVVSAEGEVQAVFADADRLVQVVMNLVENAMRHGHGLVAVTIANEERDGDPGVRMSFIDHGPGIAEDARDRIFSRFWRAGPGAGSGLGLFIVRGIVELHGGTVTVSHATVDEQNPGTDITAWIPVAEPEVLRQRVGAGH